MKPTTSLEFADDNIAEYVTGPSGSAVLVQNKVEPSNSTKAYGILARTRLPRAYLNYLINSAFTHIKYLYAGEIGDTKIVLDGTQTQGDIESRFGGTWTDSGTEVLFGKTYRLFERTA